MAYRLMASGSPCVVHNTNNNNKVFDQLEYFCPFTDLPPQSYLRYAVMQVDFAVPPGNWGM